MALKLLHVDMVTFLFTRNLFSQVCLLFRKKKDKLAEKKGSTISLHYMDDTKFESWK